MKSQTKYLFKGKGKKTTIPHRNEKNKNNWNTRRTSTETQTRNQSSRRVKIRYLIHLHSRLLLFFCLLLWKRCKKLQTIQNASGFDDTIEEAGSTKKALTPWRTSLWFTQQCICQTIAAISTISTRSMGRRSWHKRKGVLFVFLCFFCILHHHQKKNRNELKMNNTYTDTLHICTTH